MSQDIIVFVIVASTIGYVVFNFVKSLKTKNVENSCGGCTGCEVSKHKSACH